MKNKINNDAIELSRYISEFLNDYTPSHLTNSDNTVKSYETALTLYVGYLEDKCGITPDKFSQECFDQVHIEGWLKWLADDRGCSTATCNNRLSAIRAFTKYLSSRSIKYIAMSTGAVSVPYRKTIKKKVTGLSREAVKAVETTMVYLDITTEQEMKALATLAGEKNQNVSVKWDPSKDTLSDICGLRKLAK